MPKIDSYDLQFLLRRFKEMSQERITQLEEELKRIELELQQKRDRLEKETKLLLAEYGYEECECKGLGDGCVKCGATSIYRGSGLVPTGDPAKVRQEMFDNASKYFMVFEDEDEPYFGFVTKEYWEKEGCLDDQGFPSDLVPDGFKEKAESQYTSIWDVESAIWNLLREGFVEIDNPF
jgi:hypothetical protein